jgi:hypothetical protein
MERKVMRKITEGILKKYSASQAFPNFLGNIHSTRVFLGGEEGW